MNSLDLSILKVLVTNKKKAMAFVGECDHQLFLPETWNFAKLITAYLKAYKELPTLRVITEKIAKNQTLVENINLIWKEVENHKYDIKEYQHDLENIKKRYAESELKNIKDSILKLDSNTDITKTLSYMSKTIQNINALNTPKTVERKTLKDHLSVFTEKFNAKKANPNIDAGIKTQYSFFDYATNGVKAADFILICGESGFGKSLMLGNIAIQTWMQENTIDNIDNFKPGKNIIYFSLEMPYEDLFFRFLSRLSGVESRKIENASLNKEEMLKIKKVLAFINAYPYSFEIVDVPHASSNDLEKLLNDSENSVDVIFADYLGIMKMNKENDEADWLKQGAISEEIRAIARKYSLPVFSAVQLNRKTQGKVKDSSENIGLNRLARSGTIATHATTVIQIENRPNEENYTDFIYHIIKNRKGPKGKGRLLKDLSCATLLDIPLEKTGDISFDPNNPGDFNNPDDISSDIEFIEI